MGSVWDQSEAGHKPMLRQYIINAMLELVSEKGVFNVSMSELPRGSHGVHANPVQLLPGP